MKYKIIICITLSLIMSALIHNNGYCSTEALIGIKSVKVNISLNNNSIDLNDVQLKNDVELKLRLLGIKIDPNSSQTLSVKIFIMKIDPTLNTPVYGRYGTIELTMEEEVILLRNKKIVIEAPTWRSGIYYLHGPVDDFGQRCRSKVSDLTDEFINEYLSMNPK
jgi:hypothetical protein